MKKCNDCGAEKNIDDFCNQRENKDGKQGHCKSCNSKRVSKWWAARPALAREKAKKAVGKRKRRREKKALRNKDTQCRRCGFVPENMCQLTVDHIDRNHKNNAKNNLQTLCANCHNFKTKVELVWPEKLLELNLVPVPELVVPCELIEIQASGPICRIGV